MRSNFYTTALLAFVTIALFLGAVSCGVPEAPKAEIIVMDESENRIEDATVILMCTAIERPTCVLGDTATTNSEGVSKHEIEYESVLQIYAYKQINDTLLLTGESFVKLEEDKTAKETVVIVAN